MQINPRRRNIRLYFVLFSIVCWSAVAANAEEFGFDSWTTANGLPQNTVTGLAQTRDGYLWLSTFDGLARFDGVRFTIFDKGNTKGILNNRFTGIFLDKDGDVWAPTEDGIITIYRNGAFTSFQTPESFRYPIYITSDENGAAQIQTKDKVFYLRDGHFIEAPEQKQQFEKEFYYCRSGAKWTFSPSGVTRERDGQVSNFPLSMEPGTLTYYTTYGIQENAAGLLWLESKDKLYLVGNGVFNVYTKKEVPALEKLALTGFYEETDGTQWLIFGVNTNTQIANMQLVRFKDNNFTSFDLGEPVSTVGGLADREGNFWLATSKGLKRLRRQLITTLSVKDGLNSNEVYPLLQVDNGDVLIGSTNGVNRFADGKITDVGLKNQFSPYVALLRGLWQDKNSNIWLGYFGLGGFGRFEADHQLKRIGNDELATGATDFASDAAGNLWLATENGLFKFKDDRQVAHYTAADGLRSGKIITLHFDRRQNLWLGTFDGLTLFKDGKFTNYAEVENSPKGFVRVIFEDADGVLWFGTYADGLVRYKNGKFFNYHVEDGLFNNGVFAILEDDRGNFWMSSNRGIHRVSRQELNDFADGRIPKLSNVSYDEQDGMLNAECNGGRLPAAIKTKDGKLWFGTMGGVAIVDPNAEKINPRPPNVVIENVSIDRKPVDFTHTPNEIELKPGQTNIAIEYTGLSLTKSRHIKFRYKLEGLEKNWVEAGTKRTVDYSYLPAGTYTFRLNAANADGIWNSEGTAFKIIVRPYFYQTLWFKILIGMAAAFVIGLIYYTRISRLQAIAAAKTLFSKQLIESQEAERKRIASELHDGLGQNLVVIKNRAMLAIKKGDDRERVAKELVNISESATQALDEVREITNNLRPQLLDRLGLTKAINSMLKKVSDVIEIDGEIGNIDHLFNENEEICIYRIVQESLNNVIKHAEASKIVVNIKRTESRVLIKIEDNGKGFDSENISSGLGLVGLQERALLLKGELLIDTEIGKGTKLQLTLELPLE